MCCMAQPKVESGSDDLNYMGHLLVGLASLTHKLNYLDVIQIFKKSHIL